MNNKPILLIIFVLGLILGLGSYRYLFDFSPNSLPTLSSEIRSSNYKYINPLLECEIFSTAGTKELAPLRTQLNELITKKINSGLIQSASVYFRDLNNGPWFGINEEERFAPASLSKLQIMISLLKIAEEDKNFLETKIKYDFDLPYIFQDYNKPSKNIEKGKEYTVDELISQMIEKSDNQAMYLLLHGLKLNYLDLTRELNKELELSERIDSNGDQPLAVKEYASLFRVLFNASYLSRAISEKALAILTKIEYKNGLPVGVPPNTIVSHKFGQRTLPDKSEQLHDCGIVYYPKHPYLLCVMTKGSSYENLELLIRAISTHVYRSIDNHYKQSP